MLSVFFFKQKTAYEMRISDWSSDVCSSDLRARRCGDNLRLDAERFEVALDIARQALEFVFRVLSTARSWRIEDRQWRQRIAFKRWHRDGLGFVRTAGRLCRRCNGRRRRQQAKLLLFTTDQHRCLALAFAAEIGRAHV